MQKTKTTSKFQYKFLLPQHWFKWLMFFCLFILAYIPAKIRDKLAGCVGKLLGKLIKKQRIRAYYNLTLCFPDWDEAKKQQVLDQMFTLAGQILFAMGEFAFRSEKYLASRVEYYGMEYITTNIEQGKSIIMYAPHSWAVDTTIILSLYGFPVIGMYKPEKDPMIDWAWTSVRERFGGKMYARQNGIRPFVNDLKQGKIGHYSADEDYGPDASEFIDFFATYKANLKGSYKLTKLTNAVMLPVFSRYNTKRAKYEFEICAPLDLIGDEQYDGLLINQQVEKFIQVAPEQYMWILRIFSTRKNEPDPYKKLY